MEIGKQFISKADKMQLKGKMKVVNSDRGEHKDTFVSSCGNYNTDTDKTLREIGKKYNSCGGYIPPSGGHHNSCGGFKPGLSMTSCG